MNTPKLLILGSARHGKDTFAELLNEWYGLKFQSSSQAAADIFIFDELKEKYGYETSEQCFIDRTNHRQEWYEMICEYNKDDKARLAKDILKDVDCYVGMRDHQEITECMNQGLFDLIIWVDGSNRLPLEPSESFNIDMGCADIIIENNGTLDGFKRKVKRIGSIIMGKEPFIKNEISSGFLELFKSLMVEDEDGDLEIDIYSLSNEVFIHGWPKIDGELLDLENWEISDINDNGLTLLCGGDWQEPHKVELRYDGEKTFVESYTPHGFDDGLSTNKIIEILGVVPQNQK